MRCPLTAIEGRTSLQLVYNSHIQEVPFPSDPYVLIDPSRHPDIPLSSPERLERISLATKEKVILAKEVFKNLDDAQEFYSLLQRKGCYFNRPVDQALLDHPDFFRNPEFANTNPLRILVLDIEVLSDGSGVFPTASRNPIISIGACVLGQKPRVFRDYLPKDPRPDHRILSEFLTYFQQQDPDMVAGYNIKLFDIPYIVDRLNTYKQGGEQRYPRGFWPGVLTRTNKLPFVQIEEDGEKKMRYHFWGRVLMDLWDSVAKDQSLSGIKNRKLKTVAQWFKYDVKTGKPIVEVDTSDMRPLVNTEALERYQISDLEIVEFLIGNYLPARVALAEELGMPLDLVINGYSSTIPKIYTGRRCIQLGLIPLESNEDRYGVPMTPDGVENKKVKGFEAAYVDIFKFGRFNTIYKVDFTSLYPSIMTTFNLGPDTVTMCNHDLPYQEGQEPRIFADKNMFYIEIHDANYKKRFLIRVDLSRNSFIREDMKMLFEMRGRWKTEMKKHPEDSSDWILANSNSVVIKVLMNSIYGFEGMRFARFGDQAVGMAVVALGRWLIKMAVHHIKDRVIEVDTDGIYADADVDADELNALVAATVMETVGQTSYISFEKDGPWAGYFYRMKNYVLRKPKGLEFHGGVFKSSKLARCYEVAVRRLADAVISGANVDALKAEVMALRDLSTYRLEDFLMHITIGKSKYDTTKGVPFQLTLMEQAKAKLGHAIRMGESIDYYCTKDQTGYRISQSVKDTKDLDTDYYLRMITKAQEVFELQDIHKTPLQIEMEARDLRRRGLINRKAALNAFLQKGKENPLVGDRSTVQVQEEIDAIQLLQDAMSGAWPCPVCGAVGYDVRYPLLVCLSCHWDGTPVRPAKKKPVKRKIEPQADSSLVITIGEKTVLLPPDWRDLRGRLIDKDLVHGFLTAEEAAQLEEINRELKREDKAEAARVNTAMAGMQRKTEVLVGQIQEVTKDLEKHLKEVP